MKHELIIEKSANDWVHLDLGDDVPVMVFQINDLNELKDRQASYSQSLKLPLSQTNCHAFGFANVFEAQSAAPYQIHRCAYYEDGTEIIGTNFRLELLAVEGDYFECQITSNVLGLLNTLKSLTPADVPELEPFVWDVADIAAVANDVDSMRRYLFTAIYINTDTRLAEAFWYPAFPAIGTTERQLIANQIYPSFNFLKLVRAMLSAAGWALVTNADAIEGDSPYYVVLNNPTTNTGSFERLQRSVRTNAVTVSMSSTYPVPLSASISAASDNLYGEWVYMDLNETKVLRYTSPGHYRIRFNCKTLNASGGVPTGRTRYRVYDNEGNILSETEEFAGVAHSADGWTSDEIEMFPASIVYVEAYLTQGTVGATYLAAVTPEFDPDNNQKAGAGCLVDPKESFGFKTLYDILQQFVQAYGLLIDIDYATKTLRAYSFDYIRSRTDAVDWSDKIDVAHTRKTGFRSGSYAQENYVAFQESANFQTPYRDQGLIKVDNAQLEGERTLLTLGFESSRDTMYPFPNGEGINVARTPLMGRPIDRSFLMYDNNRVTRYLIWLYAPIDSKPFLIREGVKTSPRVGMVPYGGVPAPMDIRVGNAVTGDMLIEEGYAAIPKILNPARVIEAYFNLDALDIMNLDLLRPVYIEQYGDFFYIQKISNYVARSLTKVTLVCLNLTND